MFFDERGVLSRSRAAEKMTREKAGTVSRTEALLRIEANDPYRIQYGDIVKTSTGSYGFSKEIKEIMDAAGQTNGSSVPPSAFLEQLHLHSIPMIPTRDTIWVGCAMVIPNMRGVSHKFQAGTIDGNPLYASLVYRANGFDHRPRVSFYTKNKQHIRVSEVRKYANFIEQLRVASSVNERCVLVVAKVALILNGAIEGRRFVMQRDDIQNLINLCIRLPAPSLNPQPAILEPIHAQASRQESDQDVSTLSHQRSVSAMN